MKLLFHVIVHHQVQLHVRLKTPLSAYDHWDCSLMEERRKKYRSKIGAAYSQIDRFPNSY